MIRQLALARIPPFGALVRGWIRERGAIERQPIGALRIAREICAEREVLIVRPGYPLPENKVHFKMVCNTDIVNQGLFLCTILWQFGQIRAMSFTLVFEPLDNSLTGTV